jgi:HTH-type transcriptional regulator/antitoxin HigA
MAELLDFTKPHILRDEAEYTAAVAEIEQLLDTAPPPHSEACERLEFLSVLVQAYEDAHFPLEQLTTPQDVVVFMLEQKGLSHEDLAQWLGGQSHMRAFLQGIYSLSLPQIERLRAHLGIPADLLISSGRLPPPPNVGMEPTR